MEKSILKFLEFNGKAIYFLNVDGQYWIAVKPICEALRVNFDRQYKNLKNHKILGDVYANQPMRDTQNRVQNMVALPEKYIYGWLFSIQSASDALLKYQKLCYELLYNHFHGPITQRKDILIENAQLEQEMIDAVKALEENPDFIKYFSAKSAIMRNGKALKQLDREVMSAQLDLFNQES